MKLTQMRTTHCVRLFLILIGHPSRYVSLKMNTEIIATLKLLIDQLEELKMVKFKKQYFKVLKSLKENDFDTVFEIMDKSFINPLGWSHLGYPSNTKEEKLHKEAALFQKQITELKRKIKKNIT